MIEEAFSLEEESFPINNDIQSLYTSIKTSLETYIESNNQSISLKIERLTSILDAISTIISSEKSISFEKFISLINSLKQQIALLKQKEQSYKKEMTSLKSFLNEAMIAKWNGNGNSLEDPQINKIKRQYKNKELDYQCKELDYLLCINDQSKRIKELQKKNNEKKSETEIKKIRLFPHIVHTESTMCSRLNSNRSKTHVSRNSTPFITTANKTSSTFKNKKIGTIEGNEDCANEKGYMSERSNKDKVNVIMKDNKDIKEDKSNRDLMNYCLYQKNRYIRHMKNNSNNNSLKVNMLEISNMIDNHNRKGYFNSLNYLFKTPSQTQYSSFK